MSETGYTRRRFLTTMAAGAASLSAPMSVLGNGRSKRRLNVLFLFSDDQQWNAIRALGNEHIKTPNLDRLVNEGLAFTRTYCMGSWHGAVCQPSRAMLLSGRTLWHVDAQLRGNLNWPVLMKNAGFETFGNGKWHNGKRSYAAGFSRGGHVFFGGMGNHARLPVHEFNPQGKYPDNARRPGTRFSSEMFADDVIEFLRTHDREKPFFAYVSFTAPHDPRMAPEPYAGMYDPAQIPVPKNFQPEHPFDNGELRIRDEKLAPFPRTPRIAQAHIAAYYAMITHMDAQIGRILNALDRTGQADRTMVVFASDNGLAVGQHGLLGKQNMYEHSVRVPLIFKGPGIRAGKRSEALCYLLDVLPTVLELVELPVPSEVEGRSLVPVITGLAAGPRDSILCAYRDVQRMVCDERYKLIKYYVKGVTTTQLFDLDRDPLETGDLARDPAHAETVKRLEALLQEARRAADDPMLSAGATVDP